MTSSTTTRTQSLVSAALIAALMAATGWLAAQLPATAVPLTLQMFFVVLAALLLSPRWAGASMATYVVLGAIGLPVFAGGKAGLGVLTGPTGGYLLGFIAAAAIGSLVRVALEKYTTQVGADAVAALAAVAVTYTVGTVQLAQIAHLSAAQAFLAGVAPYVLFDALKAAAAVGVAAAIRRARG